MRDLEFDINARDRTAAGFNSARGNARAFNSELGSTAMGMRAAGLAAGAFAGAFTLTSVAEFGRAVKRTIDDVSDLVDLADKVGVATSDIQRMTYGFGLAGVEAENIDQILTQWSKRIGAAYTSGGRLADVFKANGVSLTDSEGNLRSSVDLMRAYADLVANAGSEQERMTLATEGFGKAGGSMVLALRDGAAGMDKLMSAADTAGGVLDDELARRVEEIGDEIDTMWRSFEVGAQRAISKSIVFLDDVRNKVVAIMDEYTAMRNAAEAGTAIGAMVGGTQPTKGGRLVWQIDQRIAGAFGTGDDQIDTALARAMRARTQPRTNIPGGPDDADSRSRSASAARDQESAFDRVIEKLRDERDMISLNETEQRILSEQRRAGVEATGAQGRAIAAVIRQIEGERAAIEKSEKQHQAFQRSAATSFAGAGDALTSIVEGSDKASTALAKLAVNFAMAAAQAALFQSGPLAGIFGGMGLGGSASGSLSSGSWPQGLNDFRSFDGGGGTGDGVRSGGLDGKGGFLAMMHPRESVIDHTKTSGGSPMTMNFHINASDAQSFIKSRSQVETMLTRAVARGQRGL